MSETIAPTLLPGASSNGTTSAKASTWFFVLTLVGGIAQRVDFRAQQYSLRLQDVQTIKIDNSAGSASFSVDCPNGDNITIPAGWQGVFPCYVPNSNPVFVFSGTGTVKITFMNFQQPLATWGATASFSYNGNSLNVYDATLAGLLGASQGSATGGSAASLSLAEGGVYRSASITLTNGQQSTIGLDVNGNVLTNGAPATPINPATFTVAVANTAVTVFPANSIVHGAFIRNPLTNPVVYIDIVNVAGVTEPGVNGTTTALQPGQSFMISQQLTTAVSMNCATAATTVNAVSF